MSPIPKHRESSSGNCAETGSTIATSWPRAINARSTYRAALMPCRANLTDPTSTSRPPSLSAVRRKSQTIL